jgi:hypothetical protein
MRRKETKGTPLRLPASKVSGNFRLSCASRENHSRRERKIDRMNGYTEETCQRFIKLRARGLTLDRNSGELHVSKRTLIELASRLRRLRSLNRKLNPCRRFHIQISNFTIR